MHASARVEGPLEYETIDFKQIIEVDFTQSHAFDLNNPMA